MGRCGGFCDRVSLVFERYRVLRGGLDGGGFVLRRFGAAVAYEGLDEIEHH